MELCTNCGATDSAIRKEDGFGSVYDICISCESIDSITEVDEIDYLVNHKEKRNV